jgi:TP901 family phage tail tape measure protein
MADQIIIEYRAKVDKLNAELNKIQKELGLVERGAKSGEDSLKKLGGASSPIQGVVKSLGGMVAGLVAVNAVMGQLKNAVNIMSNFESTMSKLQAVTKATSADMQKMSKDAQRLGASTKFTASEVGQLQVEFAKLGFSTKEILAATEATLDLAAATGTDLARSAEVAGATVRGFAMDASETVRVADVMAASFSKSALDMEKFAESMKVVAPISKAANIPIETTTALLGKLADAGIHGSMAGTGLKNLLSQLSNESSKLSKTLGYSVKNSEDLGRAFADLKEKNIDLTEATELTDERSKAAFLTLIDGADGVSKLADELKKADGAASDMAKTMSDNLAGDLDKAASAWEGLMLKLGNTKAFRAATQYFTQFITDLTTALRTTEEIAEDNAKASEARVAKQYQGIAKEFENMNQAEIKMLRDDEVGKELQRVLARRKEMQELALKPNTRMQIQALRFEEHMAGLRIQVLNDMLIKFREAKNEEDKTLIESTKVQEQTLEGLKKQLAEVKDARDKLNVSDAEGFKSKNAEISQLEELIKTLEGNISANKALEDSYKKLRREAEIALAANEEDAINLRRKFAIEDLEAQKAFIRLSEEEKGALRLNINQDFDSKISDVRMKALREQERLEKEFNDRTKKEYQDSIADIDEEFDRFIISQKQKLLEGEISWEQYADNIFKIEEAKFNRLITEAKDYEQSITNLENGLLDLKLQNLKKEQEEALKVREKIKEALQESLSAGGQIMLNQNQLAYERSQIQFAEEMKLEDQKTQNLLANLEARRKAGTITEEQLASSRIRIQEDAKKRESAIKKKQWQAEQDSNAKRAMIEAGVAFVKTLAQLGVPAGLVPAAFALAQGGIQAGFIRSQQMPAFKDGVIGLKGKGTETSDSIMARLSKGESVMTAKETKKHRGLFESIRDNNFEDYINKNYVMPVVRQKEKSKQDFEFRKLSTSEAIAESLKLNNLDTSNLERITKRNKKVRIENLDELARMMQNNYDHVR